MVADQDLCCLQIQLFLSPVPRELKEFYIFCKEWLKGTGLIANLIKNYPIDLNAIFCTVKILWFPFTNYLCHQGR